MMKKISVDDDGMAIIKGIVAHYIDAELKVIEMMKDAYSNEEIDQFIVQALVNYMGNIIYQSNRDKDLMNKNLRAFISNLKNWMKIVEENTKTDNKESE